MTGNALWLVLAAAAATALFAYTLYEARWIHVARAEIRRPELPPGPDTVTIAFLADIHAGPFFRRRSMSHLVDIVNGLHPDVIVLGGDYVGGRMGGAQIFYPAAARFEAGLAKVAVLGNHDVWEGAQIAREALHAAGFVLLENENVAVPTSGGASMYFAGVDDLYTGAPDIEKAARGIDPSEFAVLVSHNPDVFAMQLESTAHVWDLALAGHTHAGQLTFFGHWAPLVPSAYGQRFRSGWLEQSGVPVLVSRGIGAVTLPVRFFARPEINLITVRGARS